MRAANPERVVSGADVMLVTSIEKMRKTSEGGARARGGGKGGRGREDRC